MPGEDRTGPRGEGPMTGRQLGDCSGHGNFAGGGRYGRRGGFGGWGAGRGLFRRGHFVNTSEEFSSSAEVGELISEVRELKEQLKNVLARLESVTKQGMERK
jgi:hypothetical protein